MLVGRELEIRALNAHLEKMLAGSGAVLFLTGEAGLGKTTLVHEWWNGVRTEMPALFLESACSIPIGNVDVGRLEALQPWADVIAGISDAGFRSSEMAGDPSSPKSEIRNPRLQESVDYKKLAKDSASSWALAVPIVGGLAHAAIETTRLVREQRDIGEKFNLKQLIHEAAPAWAWALPIVGDVLHAAAETARLAHIQRHGVREPNFNAANQQQIFQQYVNLLTTISEKTPLVIFLDDLHWADTSSCNLLFFLSRNITNKKILLIGTYRDDDARAALDGKGHPILEVKDEILRYQTGKKIMLGYLNAEDIQAIMHASFRAYVSQPSFESWLLKISDGNSLFITQFLKTLSESGHLDSSGIFSGSYNTIATPQSALAVVEGRTRRLDAPMRRLLMYATAEGEEFTTYVLERLSEMSPMALLDDLQRAMHYGFVLQRGQARLYANQMTAIFGFSHVLFHKALYNQLLDAQKDRLHRQCYELLKAEWNRLGVAEQRAATLATKLMTHAEKCEEWETVAEVALEAGIEFWKSFNEVESLAMIDHVLAAGTHGVQSHGRRGEAFMLRGQINEIRGKHNEAISDYISAETSFRLAGNLPRAVDAVDGAGSAHLRNASYDIALVELRRALSQARMIKYGQGEASALQNIGDIYRERGAYDDAMTNYKQSLAIYCATGNRWGEAGALGSIGIVHDLLGAFDTALTFCEASLALKTEMGNRLGEASTLNNIGNIHADRGAYSEALACYEKSLVIQCTIGNRLGEANALGNIGMLHADRGEYEEALTYYQKSIVVFSAIGNRTGETYALLNIGIVHKDRGKVNIAREFLERAQTGAGEIGANIVIAEASGTLGLLAEAEMQMVAGRERDAKCAEALRLIEEASRIYAALGNKDEAEKCGNDCARIRNASNDSGA